MAADKWDGVAQWGPLTLRFDRVTQHFLKFDR